VAPRESHSRNNQAFSSALIVLFSSPGYAVLAFWLFRQGLRFVANFPGLGTLLIERLMFLLFAFLFVLLLFSNLVHQLYQPLPEPRNDFSAVAAPAVAKLFFVEIDGIGAAGIVGIPLLDRAGCWPLYGLTNHVPWHFYPATVVLIALFHRPAGGRGRVGWAVNVARYLDRRPFKWLRLPWRCSCSSLRRCG